VVVFSEDDSDGPMQQALRAGVSAYVIAGLQPQRLAPVLKVAIARFDQERQLRAQLQDAELKLGERKLIDRAKGLLMDEIGLTEEQAYAHLRKLAMDRGQRLVDVAPQVRHRRNAQPARLNLPSLSDQGFALSKQSRLQNLCSGTFGTYQ
jgi:response regulator NasT